MSRIRLGAALIAASGLAAFAATAIAATSHAKFWQNKAKTVVCGLENSGKKPAKLVICSAKGIPKAKKGIGDPFVQIAKKGKAQLVLESQTPFIGKKPTTLGKNTTWSSLGVTCKPNGNTVTCKNTSKHGFTIGNGKYKSF